MTSRLFTITVLCCAVLTCSSGCESKEDKVLQWAKSGPREPETAREWGVVPYADEEQWAAAGRKIKGVEPTLIRLIERSPYYIENYTYSSFTKSDLVWALGLVGTQKSVPLLANILTSEDDDSVQLYISTVVALADIGTPEALDIVSGVLLSDRMSSIVKVNALGALARARDVRAIPVIEKAVREQLIDEQAKPSAAFVLRVLKRKKEETPPVNENHPQNE